MPIRKKTTVIYKLLLSLPAVALISFVLPLATHAAGTGWYTPRGKDHRQPSFGSDLRVVEPYGGYYMDYCHVDPDAEDKVVYLTFDAGYENGNVEKVLDTLQAEGATGAFFILGHVAEQHPDLVRRMADEGHLVCNHTSSHKNLCGASVETVREELEKLEYVCRDRAGVTVAKYFRPPEGTFDTAMLKTVQSMGYKTVFWSFAYADWDNARQPDPVAAKKKILDNLHNGAVILLHPTSATNAAILRDVLRDMKAQGYRFGSLDELTGGT